METTEHTLIFYAMVRSCWKSTEYWRLLKKGEGLSLIDLAQMIHREFTQEDYEIWLMIFWRIWRMICQVNHGENDGVNNMIGEEGRILWNAYQEAQPSMVPAGELGVVLGSKVWKKPRVDRFRVDVDALYDPDRGRFGVGVIVRNSSPTIVLAMARQIPPKSSCLMVELMAMVHGIMICMEYKVTPIKIYTDSILVARLLADPKEYREVLPDDLCDIFEKARDGILIQVTHTYRSANRVAHALASFFASVDSPAVWTKDFPAWLMEIVFSDSS